LRLFLSPALCILLRVKLLIEAPTFYRTCHLCLRLVLETQLVTTHCTASLQSAVLRSHVVRLSVRLSVTLVICDHRLEILETNCTGNQPNAFALCRHQAIDLRTPRRTWGYFGETRGGVGKGGVLENKSGNISETRKDRGKITMDFL